MGIAWILSIVALARSFTLGLIFGGLSLLLLFFAVFYSLPPISPRKHAVLSLVWQAFSRGFLPPILCFSIYSNIQEALPYSTISFLWALGWQGSKDIGDIEADRRFGIKTLANTWGLKKLRIFTLSFTIIYIIYVVALGKLIFLLLIPLAALGLAKYTSKSKATENTVSWAVFYVGLGLIFLLTFVGEYFGR
jgi:4-hydroxybenzoate polyprenyltransferase